MLIDTERFQTLKTRTSAKFPQLIERYLLDSDLYLQTIQENIKTGNLEEISAAAHNLKSSSGLLGFLAIFEAAQRLEYTAKSTILNKLNITDFSAPFQELQKEIKLMQNFIKNEQEKP